MGFEIEISEIQSACTFSQNRDDKNKRIISSELKKNGDENSHLVTTEMEKHKRI